MSLKSLSISYRFVPFYPSVSLSVHTYSHSPYTLFTLCPALGNSLSALLYSIVCQSLSHHWSLPVHVVTLSLFVGLINVHPWSFCDHPCLTFYPDHPCHYLSILGHSLSILGHSFYPDSLCLFLVFL